MPKSNLLSRRRSSTSSTPSSVADASVAAELLFGVVGELQAASRNVQLRACLRQASLKLHEEVYAVAPFADERAWEAALEVAMADYGSCPSVPMPVIEALLGVSSERRPMLLLKAPCHAALAAVKCELEQKTIAAAVRPLERFPRLAAAVQERLQELLEEVAADCAEKIDELVSEKETFFIEISWPSSSVYPTVPLGVPLDKPVGAPPPPAPGIETLKRHISGVQEAVVKATPEKLHRWCVRAFETQVAARLCSLDLRSSHAGLLSDREASEGLQL